MKAANRPRKTPRTSGRYFIQSANDDRLVAGVATYSLEIMQELPHLDTLLVPVGAGSGVCGASDCRERDQPVPAGHRRTG